MTHDTADWPREARPTVDGRATASSRTKMQPLFRWLLFEVCRASLEATWFSRCAHASPDNTVASLSPVLLFAKTSIGHKVRHQHGHSRACLKLMLVNVYMAWSHKRHRIN